MDAWDRAKEEAAWVVGGVVDAGGRMLVYGAHACCEDRAIYCWTW